MSAASPFPDHEDAAGGDGWERTLLDHQLQELSRLAAMGMAMAGAIQQRVTSDDGSAPIRDLQHAAMDFSRVARAVRMTFALQSRLIADFKGRSQPAGAAESEETTLRVRWIGQLSPAEKARRSRLQGVVRGVAEGEALDAETVERLVLEAGERIEDDGVFGDIMTRPFGEIVALICRDLGLSPDWDSLAREVWAQEEMKSGAKGSPFAGWIGKPTRPPPLAGEGDPKGGGGMRRRWGMPPQSPRDSSPASGGARADPEGACGRRTFPSSAPEG